MIKMRINRNNLKSFKELDEPTCETRGHLGGHD